MKKFLTVIFLLTGLNLFGQVNSFETIEKIKLGTPKRTFNSHLKQLGINKKTFSSNWLVERKYDEISKRESTLIELHYTNLFNFDEFNIRERQVEHPTLIYPLSIDNNNVTSIILLLGHTGEAESFKSEETKKVKYQYFRQDINQELFFKIIDLYTQKYGNPEMTKDTLRQIKYYRLFNNKIITEEAEFYQNYVLKWRTKYYDIEIFPGFNNNAFYITNVSYSTSTNWVSSNLSDKPLEPNEKPCFTFPNIKYTLNKAGLKLIVVNTLKI